MLSLVLKEDSILRQHMDSMIAVESGKSDMETLGKTPRFYPENAEHEASHGPVHEDSCFPQRAKR